MLRSSIPVLNCCASSGECETMHYQNFHRTHWKALRYGTLIPAAGFLIAAAVHPTVSNPFYDQEESALIGLGFLALGQSFRLLEWKKFKINKNSRIWVGGFE